MVMKLMDLLLDKIQEHSKNSKDIPIGALIEKNGEIISMEFNRVEELNNNIFHCEILAINKAMERERVKSLAGYSIYVSMEPCPMCLGAILQSGIKKVYFSAYNLKEGACESFMKAMEFPFGQKLEIIGGINSQRSSKMLETFFKKVRKEKNSES